MNRPNPQWKIALEMLQSGDVTTDIWINTPPLGAEYRRAIDDLRKRGYNIPPPTRIRKGCFNYHLVQEAQLNLI
jgi:hypothetical protein